MDFEEAKGVQTCKEYNQHIRVVRFHDKNSGLLGFVAIHNDNLGPAVGGTRMYPYDSEQHALEDVLRLSRAMTYKCALAGVGHGGGKGVIIGNPEKDKTKEILKSYAQVIKKLEGRFFTGEDVGITENDVQYMLTQCDNFIGRSGYAGDPSPYASLSTFYSLQTAVEKVFGSADLAGKKIAVKGVGKVGSELVRMLYKSGAKIIIADKNKAAVAQLVNEYPDIKVGDAENIHKEEVDIYSPCALGHEFTFKTMKEIKAKIICGGANNQLAEDSVGDWLFEHGVLYVPDYVANSGGLIDVVDELEPGGFKHSRVVERIGKIKHTVNGIFTFSQDTKRAPNRVADLIAEDLFKHAKKI